MKKQLFFFLISIVSTVCFSQTDTLSTKTFKELSDLINTTFQSDRELAKKLSTYYINKGKKEANPKEQLNGLAKYIHLCILERKFDSFKIEEEKMIGLAIKHDLDEDLMKNYYALGNAYFFQGIWGKSSDLYTKALKLSRKVNDDKLESVILTQLGYIKSTIGDHEQAISYQKEALQLNRSKINDKDFNQNERRLKAETTILYLLSRSYINSKNQDSARAYIEEAINLNTLVNDSCLNKAYYRTKGEVDLLDKNYKQAISNFELSKTYCLPLNKGDSLLYSGTYGRAYIAQKKYKKALNILQKGVDDYKVKDIEEGFMDDHYKLLAKAYKHTGDIEKSNFYFEKYIHTTEEFSKIQDTVVSFFKAQEVKAFKKELNAIKSEKNQQQSYLKYLGLGATVIILSLLFLLLKFYKTKKKNEEKFQALLSKVNAASQKVAIVDTKDDILEDNSTSDINDETKQQILEGLQKLEEQEYYLRQECNSYNVAKKIKTNTSYLSKVVNTHYQKNFNTYINDLRINYAIVRLKNDSRFRQFSIQSIAEELGYKSADSFTKYFKQHTDLNPSFYIKQLNNLA